MKLTTPLSRKLGLKLPFVAAPLLEAVRKKAKPGLWSSGVGLARAGAVVLESESPSEVELRVKAPGRAVALLVVLYPEDDDWECDCDGRVDPCEHVIAAAISLGQVSKDPEAAPRLENRWTRVVYRFERAQGGLTLSRGLVDAAGVERPLEGTLRALVARPAEVAQVQVEQVDLAVDPLLERLPKGALTSDRLEALLKLLEGARNVLLDGRPVAISGEVVLPRAKIEDDGPRWVLTIAKAAELDEVLARGLALTSGSLVRLGETELTGPRLEKLPLVHRYGPEQLVELICKVLPQLASTIPVDVRSARLPAIDRELQPRILCELTQLSDGLSLLPTLVYGAPPQARIDGSNLVYLRGAVPLRDEAMEQRLAHRLRDELNLAVGRRVTVPMPEVAAMAEKLMRFGSGLSGDGTALIRSDVRLVPALQVAAPSAASGAPELGFALEFRVEGEGGGVVSAEAVVRAWSEGSGLVALDGGGFAPLPMAWLAAHGQLVADLLSARRTDGSVFNTAVPELSALCAALDQPPPAELERLLPLWQGFEGLPAATLPDDLDATLRPYQLQGASWLAFLRSAGLGGILADDMGLGKTLQTLCVLGPRSLVVCPTSVLANWEAEAARFRPGLRVCVYHGPSRVLDEEADIVLTSYALLRLDAALLAGPLWDTVVLDEAQAIKNPESQVARAAFGLNARFRVALSGTPVENRLEELWSLMHFANPGLLGGRREFVERTARPIGEGKQEAADRLRRRVRPFVLRRMKREVAPDLPPRLESILHVTLDERERALYDAVLATTRADVVALLEEGGGVMKALEALLRLRQAACHSGLLPGQEARSSSKVEALSAALESAVAGGHKALVFSQWTQLLDRVEPSLERLGISFERLDGSTRDRGAVTTRFQAPAGAPVLLMSLKAGGTGLNLTAADHVFLLDPWWNPAAEAQAADRAHRIGQERSVMVYRLVSKGTVEERILGLQEKKRALFEAALGDASAASALTRDDLLGLFA
jgi:superfamily II DNA or RNA helicase